MSRALSLPLAVLLIGLISPTSGALAADGAQNGARFDSYTRGKTLFFDWQGQPYGAERYLPGRRVIWSFLDGRCVAGTWYSQPGETGPEICFAYEDQGSVQCWRYGIDEGGLHVTIERDGPPLTLTENTTPGQEMVCLGPEVGV
ncbi:hypothetical protein TRIHO_08260 [Tritonibacter horizontis]|uniref:Uncharacterized protein n=2 Tax=Tritonibacter horizontis TaxID=1768241 RepID=A0A132C119_9RHOB|nr:hypothetical protein TRIHO_08260 [Tritonibacter horizontis]